VSGADNRRLRQRFLEKDKQVKAALGRLKKASGWRKTENTLFREASDGFVACTIFHGDETPDGFQVRAQVDVRPIAVDEVLWDIIDVASNQRRPLSLRVTSGFACCGVPISSLECSIETFEAEAAVYLEKSLSKAANALTANPFSQLCSQHLGWSSNLQAYPTADRLWMTFVCALILEREYQIAKKVLDVFERNGWGCINSFYADPQRVSEHGGYPRIFSFAQMSRHHIVERLAQLPRVVE
jgi:hypothetical protein